MDALNSNVSKIIAINRRRIGLDPADPKADQLFSNSSGAATRLCVYGRMRPGGPDGHALEPLGGKWVTCSYPGHLQNGGQCSLDECPGLGWTMTREWNEGGYLLTADALGKNWDKLDLKEGGNYARLLTPVRVDGIEAVANIYVSRNASEAQLMMLDGMNVHDEVDFWL
ncbi:MAG: hypothetical protein RH946_14935 [Rhodospirillales bacterium]